MTWYEFDHKRLVLEHLRVLARYPQFVLHCEPNGLLYWAGEINLSVPGLVPPPLRLRVDYPESFPAEYPKVYVTSPSIPENEYGHEWHRWGVDETICYIRPNKWQIGTTADQIISKAEDWYFNYVALKHSLIDKMPDEGRAKLGV
jgi:hypothetical protein